MHFSTVSTTTRVHDACRFLCFADLDLELSVWAPLVAHAQMCSKAQGAPTQDLLQALSKLETSA